MEWMLIIEMELLLNMVVFYGDWSSKEVYTAHAWFIGDVTNWLPANDNANLQTSSKIV